MTLKGNLEVLNLSDIFQSLSLNQHTGTLRVTDGKREKLVHFAQGEITLLASEKKVKLGEMLVASGKISSEDLEYALQQQKKSKKKLGEILIEEGFVSEDDIAEIVRQQIEAEIYDLFLWKKADFEFLIDYIPDKLKNPHHGITKLQFNTGSLIMEALRRLDEWGLISKEIPTLKEVYKVVNANPAALEEIDLPDRVKAEIRLIDGERSIETIAEETSLSEFELCKLIFELKSRGIVAPLTPQELSDRADDALQKGKFRQASALYERLVETLPKNLSIRWHLADSLKAFGDEARALEQYSIVADALAGTRDRQELARAYRAILDLAPDRREILEKLRALDKAKWKRSAFKSTFYVVFLVGGVAGALVVAGKDRRVELKGRALAWISSIRGGGSGEGGDARAAEARAKELLNAMEEALQAGQPARAFELGVRILREFPQTAARAQVRLPITIRSDPSGKMVYLDGVEKDTTDKVFLFAPKKEPGALLRIEIKEGARLLAAREVETAKYQDLTIDLHRQPVWRAQTEAPVRAAPVFRGGTAYFPSLDGWLHGRALADDKAPPALRIPLGEGAAVFGTAIGGIALADELVVYGTVDGEVRTFNVVTRSKGFTIRVSEQPLLTKPAIAQDGELAIVAGDDGSVNFVNVRRGSIGGSPVYLANRVTAGPIEADGTVFVAGRDNRLLAIDATQRQILWSRAARGDYLAAPVAVEGGGIFAGDKTGELVCLDRKSGGIRWAAEALGPVAGLAAGADAVYVTTRTGELSAFQLSTGRPLWSKAPAPKRPTRPVVVSSVGVVIVAGEGAVTAFEAESGRERWSAKSRAAFKGEPVLHEGRIYVGCEDGSLHAYLPN